MMKPSDLKVMPVECKTCPFKLNDKGLHQNIELVNAVTERTLFKGQQICHHNNYNKKKEQFRCKGSYDYNMEIYKRMGLENYENYK